MLQATKLRLSATLILATAAAWLAGAYVAAPEFWTFRDRNRPRPAMLTATAQGIPGDPINVGFLVTSEELLVAFGDAGWKPADPVTFRTAVEIGASVVFDRPDPTAPVSRLLFEGRPRISLSRSRSGPVRTSATTSACGLPPGRATTAGRSGSGRRASTKASD